MQRIRQGQGKRQVCVMGADTTFVTCDREQVTIAIGVDALQGDVLEIELVDAESVEAMRPFITDLVKVFEVEILLSDDQDSYKTLADELAVKHGVCRAHVNRNVADLVAQLGERALSHPDPVPADLPVTVDQFIDDLLYFELLVALRPTDGPAQLRTLYRRYMNAPPPAKGEKATLWYRFRLAVLRWWQHWSRLTLDQHWQGPNGETLDGTNNAAERAIGWWVKERYRTMRSYKRRRSVLNVTYLITYLGARAGHADLAALLAA